MTEILGNIHSIESCGTVDGPGIRFVVFFQGCPLRCAYCHNPDTWDFAVNQKMSVEDILKKYDGVKEFLKNGGITATGGEPIAQIDFLTGLFKAAKEKNIHTALDTSGILFNLKNIDKNSTPHEMSFRFLQSIPEVKVVLSGMSNMEQLSDNIKIFDTI